MREEQGVQEALLATTTTTTTTTCLWDTSGSVMLIMLHIKREFCEGW